MCKENVYRDLIVITNRGLVEGDFLEQIKKVAKLHPTGLILREKDLEDEEYFELARAVQEICLKASVPFYIHGRINLAMRLECRNIHLPLLAVEGLDRDFLREHFENVSVSCHSMEDLKTAIEKGATRIILGTIFETECKKGLKGKGLDFVREICDASPVPVYAIGGIKLENLGSVKDAGATGGCMMSGFMRL